MLNKFSGWWKKSFILKNFPDWIIRALSERLYNFNCKFPSSNHNIRKMWSTPTIYIVRPHYYHILPYHVDITFYLIFHSSFYCTSFILVCKTFLICVCHYKRKVQTNIKRRTKRKLIVFLFSFLFLIIGRKWKDRNAKKGISSL